MHSRELADYLPGIGFVFSVFRELVQTVGRILRAA
jgi:hypothetical protein